MVEPSRHRKHHLRDLEKSAIEDNTQWELDTQQMIFASLIPYIMSAKPDVIETEHFAVYRSSIADPSTSIELKTLDPLIPVFQHLPPLLVIGEAIDKYMHLIRCDYIPCRSQDVEVQQGIPAREIAKRLVERVASPGWDTRKLEDKFFSSIVLMKDDFSLESRGTNPSIDICEYVRNALREKGYEIPFLKPYVDVPRDFFWGSDMTEASKKIMKDIFNFRAYLQNERPRPEFSTSLCEDQLLEAALNHFRNHIDKSDIEPPVKIDQLELEEVWFPQFFKSKDRITFTEFQR